MEAWISGVSARRAPITIQRMAGMLAKVGVRTWTRAGVAGAFFPGDAVHDLAARSFDAAGGGAGDEVEFVVAGVDFAGRQLGERLTKNLAALHDFERADEQAGADVAGGLRRARRIPSRRRQRRARRGACPGQAGGARGGTDDAAGDGFFLW